MTAFSLPIEEGDLWGAKVNLVLGQAAQGAQADVSVRADHLPEITLR